MKLTTQEIYTTNDREANHDADNPQLYDLCSIYDFHDDPPADLIDDWYGRLYEPFPEIIVRKIGNTWYTISTDCEGTESLADKVKRLIFTDPLPEMTLSERTAIAG